MELCYRDNKWCSVHCNVSEKLPMMYRLKFLVKHHNGQVRSVYAFSKITQYKEIDTDEAGRLYACHILLLMKTCSSFNIVNDTLSSTLALGKQINKSIQTTVYINCTFLSYSFQLLMFPTKSEKFMQHIF